MWAVLEGRGELEVNGRLLVMEHPGAYPVVEHGRHTAGILDLRCGPGLTCHAVCFSPGVVDP